MMRSRSAISAVAIALALGVIALILLSRRASPPSSESTAVSLPDSSVVEASPSSFREAVNTLVGGSAPEVTPPVTTSNIFQRIASGEVDLQLSSEQIAEYLRRHGTNVETLLAIHGDEYLRLAAELFPNDPRVQYSVITRDIFPEAKREWLELFKQSAPDNPVANYLSAREYLRAGDRERGLQELIDAAGKSRFNDYTVERWQNAEEAHLSAGRSVAEAKMAAGITLPLPQLAVFKSLAQEMQAIQKEYVGAGDTASAEALAQMGHRLAQHLGHGENSRPLINQLVAAAIDRIVLSPLPAESQPEFLGRPVQQHMEERNNFRKDVRTLLPQFDDMLARGHEAEIIGYFDRLKVQGEYKALLWLRDRSQLR